MNTYEEMELDAVGRQAKAHIDAGDKAKDRAEQQYLAAGLYLMAAKVRVQRTKGLTWPLFLREHCPVGRRRADEIIMIADGRTTIQGLNAAKNAARSPASRSVRAQSPKISQQKQREAASVVPEEVMEESRDEAFLPPTETIDRILTALKRMSQDQLDEVEVLVCRILRG